MLGTEKNFLTFQGENVRKWTICRRSWRFRIHAACCRRESTTGRTASCPPCFKARRSTRQKPIFNLAAPRGVSRTADAAARDALKFLNEKHLEKFPGDFELSARISSYELAAKMQLSVPEVADLSRESATTLEGDPRSVGCCAHSDRRQRGLLEDTLGVWTTEFGRMPTFQKGATGRDHNPNGFTIWLTGAGVKRGFSYGATDDLGHKAVEKVTTIYDLHATILHLLGLDHERLSFYHNGIERRLTDVHGHVLADLLV